MKSEKCSCNGPKTLNLINFTSQVKKCMFFFALKYKILSFWLFTWPESEPASTPYCRGWTSRRLSRQRAPCSASSRTRRNNVFYKVLYICTYNVYNSCNSITADYSSGRQSILHHQMGLGRYYIKCRVFKIFTKQFCRKEEIIKSNIFVIR